MGGVNVTHRLENILGMLGLRDGLVHTLSKEEIK